MYDSCTFFFLLLRTVVANPPKYRTAKWLDAPDPSRTHNGLLEEQHTGTGKWFLESDEFVKWLETPESNLWIEGMRTQDYAISMTPRLFILFQLEMEKASYGSFSA